MARPGFMIWHEDGNILNEASDHVVATIFRGLYLFSTTGEVAATDLSGMETALFQSMVSKIARDDEKYNNQAKENAIKGLISAIKRQATADGRKLTSTQARIQAERIYYSTHPAIDDSGQPRLTAADSGQLSKRSEAERNESVSYPESVSPAQEVTGAKAEAITGVSVQEVSDYLKKQRLIVEDHIEEAAYMFIQYEKEHNWTYGGQPIIDWKAVLYEYVHKVYRHG